MKCIRIVAWILSPRKATMSTSQSGSSEFSLKGSGFSKNTANDSYLESIHVNLGLVINTRKSRHFSKRETNRIFEKISLEKFYPSFRWFCSDGPTPKVLPGWKLFWHSPAPVFAAFARVPRCPLLKPTGRLPLARQPCACWSYSAPFCNKLSRSACWPAFLCGTHTWRMKLFHGQSFAQHALQSFRKQYLLSCCNVQAGRCTH